MKKRLLSVVLALVLGAMALPALASEPEAKSLPSGQVVVGPLTVYEGIWPGAAEVGTLAVGTGVLVVEIYGEWMQVFSRVDRVVGWVPSNTILLDQQAMIYPGIVISQNVSLRAEPSTGATRLATISNGTVLDLLNEQNGWYQVAYYDGKSVMPLQGWVRNDYIVRNPSFITTTALTYVYAMPALDSKKVGQLVAGTQLVVIGEFGDFWVVNLRSASGFIYKRDISSEAFPGGNG